MAGMATHRSTLRDLVGEDADGKTYPVQCELVEQESTDPQDASHRRWELTATHARLEDGRALQQDGEVWKMTSGKPELVLKVVGLR